MSPTVYHIIHLSSAFLLVALTFRAFAAPRPEARRQTLALAGVASLLMLVAGFGLHAKLYSGTFPGWLVVKLVCWLGLSALAGIAYRRPAQVGLLGWVAFAFVVTAVWAVYAKPF